MTGTRRPAVRFALLPSRNSAEKYEGLAWRIPLLAVIYVAVYFCAPVFYRFQAPALRTYYADGAGISLPPFIALQLVRGAMGFVAVFDRSPSQRWTPVRAILLASAVFDISPQHNAFIRIPICMGSALAALD